MGWRMRLFALPVQGSRKGKDDDYTYEEQSQPDDVSPPSPGGEGARL